MVERIAGQNLPDGRRDLVCCPKCLGAGSYKPEPTVKESLAVRGCYQPHDVTDADAARALEEYQRLTMAAWPVMGAVA